MKQAGKIALSLSRLTEIGEQAIAAISANLGGGGPVLKGQLIACRFYEAMQRELKRLPVQHPRRAALVAASDRCERIATASINPNALLDELKTAIAALRSEADASAPPPRARPVLRVIEGGLSN